MRIILIIMPPVMVLVSWYVKSANRLDPARVMTAAMVAILFITDKILLRLYRKPRRRAVQSVFREESTVEDLTIRPMWREETHLLPPGERCIP